MNGYVLLDTRKIDEAIGMRENLLSEYESINNDFSDSVENLLKEWEGAGADAFRKDTKAIQSNLAALNDILKTMCDMLADCRDVFAECDKALGEFNKNPTSE